MKTLLTFCILLACLLGNAFSQDSKVSLEQTHAKWLDSKIVGDRYLIQTFIPDQKTVPIDSLPIVFVLDADMSFGLVYDIVRWLQWGRETPYVELFNNYIILGPALLWKDKEIFKQESKFAEGHYAVNANVFIAIGEFDNEEIKKPYAEFVDRIKSRNYKGLISQYLDN